jgi:hypothetical protein
VRILVAAATLALALAGGAGASSRAVYTVKLGDTIEVLGSRILCTVQKGSRILPGKTLIGCVEATSKGPVVGSYAVALATNGAVAMAKVKANGEPLVVLKRTPSAVGAVRSRVLSVRVGDAFLLGGSAVACSINQPTGGSLTASCFLARSGTLVPNSYAVGITDLYAFVSRVDSARKAKPISLRKHGK